MQVDLVSMRKKAIVSAEGTMKRYILCCKDHFTKFVYLDAIAKKTPEICAESLAKYFVMVGYPLILQTDNGLEFIGQQLVDRIKELCPDCVMVRGRPRHRTVKKELKRQQKTLRLQNEPYGNWVKLLLNVTAVLNGNCRRPAKATPFHHLHGRPYHPFMNARTNSLL
jgi:hypothetical protein